MPKVPTEIKSLARSHTESALNVLSGIMNETSAPAAARVAAAQCLLDRGWGKATQAIEVTGELTSKVIRAPALAPTPGQWASDHVPKPHIN